MLKILKLKKKMKRLLILKIKILEKNSHTCSELEYFRGQYQDIEERS